MSQRVIDVQAGFSTEIIWIKQDEYNKHNDLSEYYLHVFLFFSFNPPDDFAAA